MPHTRDIKRVALLSSGPPISLKVLYCLHLLGVETDILDLSTPSAARYSRYRRRYQRIEVIRRNGEFDAEATGRVISEYVREHQIDALVGGDIPSAGILDAVKAWLSDAIVFPTSSIEKLELLDDKWSFYQLMVEHGIPSPRTVLLEEVDELEEAVSALSFPLVAKPLHGESSHGVVCVDDLAGLRNHLRSTSKYARLPLLLQEYVRGQDADISILSHGGEIQCYVTHSRTDGCMLDFLRNDAVFELAGRIAKAADYTGVANIDVRIDSTTGAVYVLECNPRFWYTLQASLWRGLNFVEAGFDLARGKKIARDPLVGGRYYLHGCLLTRIVWRPQDWGSVESYNWKGLFQALSDPLPFIAQRF